MAIIASPVIGNLAADCEQTVLGQTPALKFRIGSTRSRKDKNGQKITDWVSVVSFRTKLAPYLLKGTKVAIFGEIEANPWAGQQGQLNAGLQITADRIEFLGSASGNDGQGQQQQYQAQPAPQQAYQAPPQPQYQQPVPPYPQPAPQQTYQAPPPPDEYPF